MTIWFEILVLLNFNIILGLGLILEYPPSGIYAYRVRLKTEASIFSWYTESDTQLGLVLGLWLGLGSQISSKV